MTDPTNDDQVVGESVQEQPKHLSRCTPRTPAPYVAAMTAVLPTRLTTGTALNCYSYPHRRVRISNGPPPIELVEDGFFGTARRHVLTPPPSGDNEIASCSPSAGTDDDGEEDELQHQRGGLSDRSENSMPGTPPHAHDDVPTWWLLSRQIGRFVGREGRDMLMLHHSHGQQQQQLQQQQQQPAERPCTAPDTICDENRSRQRLFHNRMQAMRCRRKKVQQHATKDSLCARRKKQQQRREHTRKLLGQASVAAVRHQVHTISDARIRRRQMRRERRDILLAHLEEQARKEEEKEKKEINEGIPKVVIPAATEAAKEFKRKTVVRELERLQMQIPGDGAETDSSLSSSSASSVAVIKALAGIHNHAARRRQRNKQRRRKRSVRNFKGGIWDFERMIMEQTPSESSDSSENSAPLLPRSLQQLDRQYGPVLLEAYEKSKMERSWKEEWVLMSLQHAFLTLSQAAERFARNQEAIDFLGLDGVTCLRFHSPACYAGQSIKRVLKYCCDVVHRIQRMEASCTASLLVDLQLVERDLAGQRQPGNTRDKKGGGNKGRGNGTLSSLSQSSAPRPSSAVSTRPSSMLKNGTTHSSTMHVAPLDEHELKDAKKLKGRRPLNIQVVAGVSPQPSSAMLAHLQAIEELRASTTVDVHRTFAAGNVRRRGRVAAGGRTYSHGNRLWSASSSRSQHQRFQQFPGIEPTVVVAYTHQGDARKYTANALLKRAVNLFDIDLVREVRRWWLVARPQGPREDTTKQWLDRNQYLHVFLIIHQCLTGEHLGNEGTNIAGDFSSFFSGAGALERGIKDGLHKYGIDAQGTDNDVEKIDTSALYGSRSRPTCSQSSPSEVLLMVLESWTVDVGAFSVPAEVGAQRLFGADGEEVGKLMKGAVNAAVISKPYEPDAHMSSALFFRAMFRLADAWCISCEVIDIVAFLKGLFRAVTYRFSGDGKGKRTGRYLRTLSKPMRDAIADYLNPVSASGTHSRSTSRPGSSRSAVRASSAKVTRLRGVVAADVRHRSKLRHSGDSSRLSSGRGSGGSVVENGGRPASQPLALQKARENAALALSRFRPQSAPLKPAISTHKRRGDDDEETACIISSEVLHDVDDVSQTGSGLADAGKEDNVETNLEVVDIMRKTKQEKQSAHDISLHKMRNHPRKGNNLRYKMPKLDIKKDLRRHSLLKRTHLPPTTKTGRSTFSVSEAGARHGNDMRGSSVVCVTNKELESAVRPTSSAQSAVVQRLGKLTSRGLALEDVVNPHGRSSSIGSDASKVLPSMNLIPKEPTRQLDKEVFYHWSYEKTRPYRSDVERVTQLYGRLHMNDQGEQNERTQPPHPKGTIASDQRYATTGANGGPTVFDGGDNEEGDSSSRPVWYKPLVVPLASKSILQGRPVWNIPLSHDMRLWDGTTSPPTRLPHIEYDFRDVRFSSAEVGPNLVQ